MFLFHPLVISIDFVYKNLSSNSFNSSKIKEMNEGVKPIPIRDQWYYYKMGLGDTNLNGLNYEMGDALLFIDYFLNGISIFVNREAQKIASDANFDKCPLHVSDLVYMLNYLNDKIHSYKTVEKMDTAEVSIDHGMLTISGIDIGGLYITTKGNSTSMFKKLNMEIKSQYYPEADVTKILVFSFDSKFLNDGELFDLSVKDILELQVSTKNGRRVYVDGFSNPSGEPDIVTSIILFENPNNTPIVPLMNLKQQELVLEIFDIDGNKVSEIIDQYPPGKTMFIWDGIDLNNEPVASGIYNFKISTDDVAKTGKMVFVK